MQPVQRLHLHERVGMEPKILKPIATTEKEKPAPVMCKCGHPKNEHPFLMCRAIEGCECHVYVQDRKEKE